MTAGAAKRGLQKQRLLRRGSVCLAAPTADLQRSSTSRGARTGTLFALGAGLGTRRGPKARTLRKLWRLL